MRSTLPDGSLLVQRSGEVLQRSHAGWADAAADVPCTAATAFQIASISKHFTAAAALLLIERDLLSLADPVTRWFPGDDSRWQSVTIHHLMSHTGGVGHWEDYPEIDLYVRPTAPMTELILARPPNHELGQFAYSSPGYVLLARVVEAVAGEPYGEFVRQRLFDPAGMTDSFIGEPGGRRDLAVPQQGEERIRSFELGVVALGAGDVWATPDDLMRWDTAIRDGRVLSEHSQVLSFSRKVEVPDSGNAYGYGWTLGEVGARPARFHGGDNLAYRTLHVWWPDTDLRFIALTNSQLTTHEELHELAHHIGRTR